jgi:hypothetical protein
MWDLWWAKWHWDRISSSTSDSYDIFIPSTVPHSTSPGAATIGQLVADVPSGLTLTPPQAIKIKKCSFLTEIFHYRVSLFG